IGKKGEDKGVLIFLTLKERKMRIETGYGVEGILPDGLVGEIRDRYMIPYFKENRFGEGLIAGVEAISKVLQEGGLPKKTKKKGLPNGLLLTGILFGLILLPLIFRSRSLQRRGAFGFPIYVGGFGSRGGAFGGGFGGFGGGMSGGGGAGGSF
ncbi:MAG: TPM domain-containing protein, partial [Desulfatiglandales bacterium]